MQVLVAARAAEVVGGDAVAEVLPELVVAVVMIAFDRRFLDGSVHLLDLAADPRMLHLGQAVLDAILVADAVEGIFVASVIDELIPLSVSTDGWRRHCGGQIAKELGGDHLADLLVEFDKRELAGPVDRHEQASLALKRSAPGQCRYESSRSGMPLNLHFGVLSPVTSGNRLIRAVADSGAATSCVRCGISDQARDRLERVEAVPDRARDLYGSSV